MAEWPYNTSTWAALRLAKLHAEPLCETCRRLGRLTPASHVDHRTAIKAGGDPFPALEELASLCPSCHSRKTNAHDRPDRRPGAGAMQGCGVDGLPLDPEHPFVAGGGGLTGRGAVPSRPAPPSNAHLVRNRRGG